MSNEENLTSEEIKSLRNLLDIEKIKELRLRYSYHMDARDLDKLMDVFAEGAVCGYGPYGDWVGKEVIYNNSCCNMFNYPCNYLDLIFLRIPLKVDIFLF